MSKSTHKGHCQVCGAFQKLHNGTNEIYNHGFKRSGHYGYWTSAQCWGSHYEPIEISNSIVEESLRRAKVDIKMYAQDIEAQLDMTDPIVTIKWHKPSQRGLTVHMSKIEDISDDPEDPFIDNKFEVTWEFPNGDTKSEILTGTEYEIKEKYCSAEIRKIEFKVSKIKSYITKQEENLHNWVAKPLIKI
ncbi:MAG: hypothetical protein ACR2OP_02645 [Amylibacter sp.]